MTGFDIINSSSFKEVRTITVCGETWYVAKDVCKFFGDREYKRNISKVFMGYTSDEKIDGKEMLVVNERGLFSLMFLMNPPKPVKWFNRDRAAEMRYRRMKLKQFQRWVAGEVLPCVYKIGLYATPEKMDELMAEAEKAKREREVAAN